MFKGISDPPRDDYARPQGPDSPPAALETVLRDGPSVGVYVLAWCDTVTNLNRVLTRGAAGEFGARVAFQMSENDSGHLLGTPAASRLGPNRALFVDEEQGQTEKFRPYGPPPHDWLAWVADRFRRRGPY